MSDRDVLMTRVIDGEASASDWAAFRRLAENEPEIWRELEETQSMNSALCAVVGEAALAAGTVELESPEHAVFHNRLRSARTWGGWLIAAAVMLAWSLNLPAQGPGVASTSGIGPAMGPGMIRVDEPVDALRAYVDRGREAGTVVGLAPDVRVLEARARDDGAGFEVLLVRQIIERQQVDQVYRWTQDEMGNLIPIRVEQTQPTTPRRPF